MPISKKNFVHGPVCRGFACKIRNRDELARQVGQLLLGHFKAINQIHIKGLQSLPTTPPRDEVKRLRDRLNNQSQAHRDGLIFQSLSWIAARHIKPNTKTALKAPHIQASKKGFDSMVLTLTQQNNLDELILCEDKATINPRQTVRDDVWPEFVEAEEGYRRPLIRNKVTQLLDRLNRRLDIEENLESIIEKAVQSTNNRAYRVNITIPPQKNTKAGRKAIFKGYNAKVAGSVDRRKARVFPIKHLRCWMTNFAKKIIAEL